MINNLFQYFKGLLCLFASDWEGEWGFGDLAAEITAIAHPKGPKIGAEFFSKISKYDDWLEKVLPGYRAGTTLLLVFAFLKAWGYTDEKMKKFMLDHLRLIPRAVETLTNIRKKMPVTIISTTYSSCMVPIVVEQIGIPREDLICTEASLDECHFLPGELKQIERFAEEIGFLPELEWGKDVSSYNQLSLEMKAVADRMWEIFFGRKGLMLFPAHRNLLERVKVVGGEGKAVAIFRSCRNKGISLERTAFIDDSITGAKGLGLVRESGGLAMAVNGNKYAVEKANAVCLLDNALPLDLLLHVFARDGMEKTMDLINNWGWPAIEHLDLEDKMVGELKEVYPINLPLVRPVNTQNVKFLTKKSEAFRKEIRGIVGALG